nr:Ultrabithorax homeotic protein 6.28 - fruit fly (Drosophila melanogaster) [Drosophila melanogaster]
MNSYFEQASGFYGHPHQATGMAMGSGGRVQRIPSLAGHESLCQPPSAAHHPGLALRCQHHGRLQ